MNCTLCHGEHDDDVACPPLPRAPKSAMFRAKFGGHCYTCSRYIPPGTDVRMTEDGLVHEDCDEP